MSIREYLDKALTAYCDIHGPSAAVDAFRIFRERHDELASRKNLAGHVTGSAIVWHKSTNTILRVYHAKLNCWVFSAGGHMDEGEMPWQTAIRELGEETGITATPVFDTANPMPLIFDAHPIAASLKKNEPAHWHYDVIYLFTVEEKPRIIADPLEIARFHWVDVDAVTKENSPVLLREQMLRYGV